VVDLVVINPSTGPLPVDGWKVSQRFSTEVTETRSGAEQRVQRWVPPKRLYEIPFDVLTQTQFVWLRNFHRLRGGSARGFLLWDVSDFYASAQNVGIGNGTATTFQLQLSYSDGGNSFTENLLHPVPTGTSIPNPSCIGPASGATVTANAVTVGGSAETEGTAYTISPSTGIVTFTTAPASGATILWTGWYYIPVRFDSDEFSLDLDVIYAKSVPRLVQVFNE
jgi:hypothetical protein